MFKRTPSSKPAEPRQYDATAQAQTYDAQTYGKQQVIGEEANKVLRNTYALLALTIGFSAITATLSTVMNVGFINPFIQLASFYGLLFAIEKTKNSGWGLALTFVFTGWLGFCIGPLVNMVIAGKGAEPVIMALGSTSLVFFGLSAYALITKKDFSFMTGFIVTGVIIAMIAVVANLFLSIPALQMAIMAVILLLSCAIILWQTSSIVHGGETNYISATVTLYVSIYNIFSILLSFFGSND